MRQSLYFLPFLFLGHCASHQAIDTNKLEHTKNTTWDLSDLCKDESQINQKMTTLLTKAKKFKKTYAHIFKESFNEKKFIKVLQEYESLNEDIAKLLNYTFLKHVTHLDDENISKMNQNVSNISAQIQSELVFFSNGLTKMKNTVNHPHYTYWLKCLKRYAPHILDNKTEAYSAQKNLTSQNAWVRLYDETLSQITFKIDDKPLELEEVLTRMSDPNENMRKKAAHALSEGLKTQAKTFVRIINTIAQDGKIENQFRHYKNPDDKKHIENDIEKEVADLLCETVKENYKNLSHRYYKLKAKLLGKQKLEYWDRNAPIFKDAHQNIPYEEAKAMVKKAYMEFSPTMAGIVQCFYDHPRIDVYPRKGKRSGAFSAATVPSVHPYILLNYQNKIDDVSTLAHELGHGIHQTLAASQGLFLNDAPLTIAETASVFGEMLTFESTKHLNPKALIAGKIEDMLNTVIRQIAFYEFEKAVHQHIKVHGEITSKEINALFRKTQEEALGPYVNLDPIVDGFWMHIHHFFHSPFYVYSYAFGDCLVNSLYAQYKKAPDKNAFEKKYLEFLKAGGSKSYGDLLRPFGLDPKQKSFWEDGLRMITDMINDLERRI